MFSYGTLTMVLSWALDILLSRGPSFGLRVNVNKCEIFWPSGDQDFLEFDPEIQRTVRVSNGVDFLGSPVYGSDTYFVSSVSKQIDKILHQQIQLSVLDDPQVELHLLRSCLDSCKMNHIIRTMPPLKIFDELLRFDAGLQQSFETLTASSISDQTWLQATLPIRLGGVGLQEASSASSAAFIGSCNSSRQLSFQLLHNSMPISILKDDPSDQLGKSVDLIIPGETQCQQHLASILPGFSDCIAPVSTQHDIQQILDNNAKCNIEESCLSLRDQA